MKFIRQTMIAALLSFAGGADAQLRQVPEAQPQSVFGGQCATNGGAACPRGLDLRWKNQGYETLQTIVSARIIQASSATMVRIGDAPWKTIRLLPQQTILESAQLDFPAVTAETKIFVEWIGNTNQLLGRTEVWVYPSNLLGELKIMLGEDTLGVLDPNNEIKPLLKQNGVDFLDLGERALEEFRGKLAILGPFHSKSQLREGLTPVVQKLSAQGVAVVWLPPPPSLPKEIAPSFYTVTAGKAAVVIAQPELVAHLADNPKSQLNLLHCCKAALNPEPFSIPNFSPQP